jgi:hypothetical protein
VTSRYEDKVHQKTVVSDVLQDIKSRVEDDRRSSTGGQDVCTYAQTSPLPPPFEWALGAGLPGSFLRSVA